MFFEVLYLRAGKRIFDIIYSDGSTYEIEE